MGLLASEDRIVRRNALHSLARKGSTIRDVDTLLRFIGSKAIPVRERALALNALERTLTIPAARLPGLIKGLHPVLRLFGARCLCVAGDRAAMPFLIDLLDTHPDTCCFTDVVPGLNLEV